MSFIVGQVVRVRTTFKNENGELFNPPVVDFKIKDQDGTITTPSTIHIGTGVFDCHVKLTEAGTWWYRTTGLEEEDEIAADEGPIEVAHSEFE